MMATQAFFQVPTITTPVPTVVQHISSFTNIPGIGGVASSIYTVPIDNPVGSGNCICAKLSYPNGSTVTITDTLGNSWPGSPSASVAGGTITTAVFLLPNARAGQTVLTITFGAVTSPFEYKITEVNNVATSSPLDGSHSAASVTGASLAAGSFTPTTNNNANGGHMILAYFDFDGSSSSGNPSSWVAGGSFTLLDGTIDWTSNQGWPSSSQWWLQTTNAAVNASTTATGDTADKFNCLAIALKAASAGTPKPAGIHLDKLLHFTPWISASTKLLCPASGNTRAISVTNDNLTITSVTDSEGQTWPDVANNATNAGGYMFVCPNRSANPNLVVTLAISNGANTANSSFRFYDISGGAASPVDVVTHASSVSGSGTSYTDCPPALTPTTSNGLVICAVAQGTGPATACTTQVADMCTGNDQTDGDLMENADGLCHVYNSGTGVLHFSWTAFAGSPMWGAAVALKHA